MRQHLIVDADDTLWENNIYFELAFDEFVDYLKHSKMTPPEIRTVLDEIELANAKVHGYGSLKFGHNLGQCYERLVERDVSGDDLAMLLSFAAKILEQPMVLLEGVPETLEYLASRHDLTLFTKGHPEEQKLKIDRSGLGVYFGHTAIVKEKNREAYAELIRDRDIDPKGAWMIGNSPRSDINPALEAGLNAVFIPHPRTWGLEQEEIRSGSTRLLTITKFSELRNHF